MTEHPTLAALAPRLALVPTLDAAQLEAEETAVLGRKNGALTALLRQLPSLGEDERRRVGQAANHLKAQFEVAFAERRAELARAKDQAEQAGLDLTMPGRARWVGGLHPVTQVLDEILGIFRELGFVRVVGPEAETEWHNFTALNFPADHPAMDLHDTFYVDTGDRRTSEHDRRRGRSSGLFPAQERRSVPDRRRPTEGRVLLRTHTSPVQVRTMLQHQPPIRAVMPGLVYRKDPFDPSHAPAFLQLEGLAVDEGISFVDLKATLTHFARRFFSPRTAVRFRPSYFPFTEPSAEMDVECQLCGGAGCPACKHTGWMEILGCGMVHPRVLRNCEVDPERFTGYAFGMGPQRIAMQRYGITDIRLLYGGDMRFLSQFSG
ncbi:MAG TPA: phenylalanine--tRNA ligase subunit alpha [Gemmatimonadales bacterium]|nr:phenylalanine--tRNA ligase subunit alpha [Gemmatimonadales bacterium]